MLFSSLEFLFRFLPIFLFLYYIVPMKFRNGILFAGSVVFYALGEVKYVPLLFLAILVNYLCGLGMERAKQKETSGRAWLILGLLYHFGLLFFFKYTNFFFQELSDLLRGSITLPQVNVELPLGISFFTFASASYLCDVYLEKIPAERRITRLSLYSFMFPQLLSGPIVRYQELHKQVENRNYSFQRVESGLKIFVIGLSYKVILADQLSTLWNSIQTIGFESISTPFAWMGMISYSLQLYFDFSGYSLMAIGVGEMLGFQLPVNFAHPYMARSVSEFFRRWHITLGDWFRDYVYIPLGGNRKGRIRQIFNLAVVWILTGLWHGAGNHFILWGCYLFFFIMLEKLVLQKFLGKYNVISRIYLLLVIALSWMIFVIPDLNQLGIYIARLFPFLSGNHGIAVNALDYVKQLKSYGVLLLLGIFLATPIPMRWYIKWKNHPIFVILFLAIFWYCVYLVTLGNNNPFLYFRF